MREKKKKGESIHSLSIRWILFLFSFKNIQLKSYCGKDLQFKTCYAKDYCPWDKASLSYIVRKSLETKQRSLRKENYCEIFSKKNAGI